jgi:isopentenyl phosphate kinase
VTIVKLGGSVITFKDSTPPRVNLEVVSRVAKEIGNDIQNLILVLGGGAHGHQAAHLYGYGDDSTPKENLLRGIPLIRRNMTNLAMAVESEFEKIGSSSVIVSPFMFATMNEGLLSDFPVRIFTHSLDAGLTAVTHGDVCFDSARGASILSGDTIVAYLSRKLNVTSVLIGTNVDGVYDSDPKANPDAVIIPKISSDNIQDVIAGAGPSGTTDVTGGMGKKMEELLGLSSATREVVIFNLLVSGRLRALLNGESVLCTRIQA